MVKDITFICVYNNEEQLQGMLLHSFEKSDNALSAAGLSYNIISVNNKTGLYGSASQAYNTIVKNNENNLGRIIVFLHQDIAFDNIDFWIRLVDEFKDEQNQIIGVAGIDGLGRVLSNLKYLEDKSFITENHITQKTRVLSLDECCFAISKELFLKLFFDEDTCNHWHLYAVDLCYSAQEKYCTMVSVIPEEIYHKEKRGGLSVDKYYLDTLWKIVKKYRMFTDTIFTSCYTIQTNMVLATLDIAIYRLRLVVRHIIHNFR